MTHVDTQDEVKVKGNVKKVQRVFTQQELDKIWADRWKKQKDLAYEHKTSRTQIKRILDKLKREREARELSQAEIVSIAKATPKVKTELVTKLVETKLEAMEIESRYKSQKIATQNALHDAMVCDIENARVLMQKATSMAMDSLSKAVGELDHSNAMSVMSVATACEKIATAQQKHMATLMKVGERYGIVDETPRAALIDQSTTLTQNNHAQKAVTINLIQHQPSSKRIIPADVIDGDISSISSV